MGTSTSSSLGLDEQFIGLFKSAEEGKGQALCGFMGPKVSCGLFGIGDDFLEKYQSLDLRFIKNQASTFFFETTGDSMAPLILPKDILIVDRSLEVSNNKIIVAHLDGAMVCKRYHKKINHIILKSENKIEKPIDITEESNFIIFGVVTAIAREV